MSDETATLKGLFKTGDLDTVVWRENVDHVLPPGVGPGGAFDLTVQTFDRGTLRSNNVEIGVTYLPAGPVLAGVQSIRAGTTRVFRCLVKPGAELAIVMSDTTDVAVSASAAGTGQARPAEETDHVEKGARSIGPWVLGALALYWLIREGGSHLPKL